METIDTLSAPQVKNFYLWFKVWRLHHAGNEKDFYDFMTTPSLEREDFIRSLGKNISCQFNESVFSEIIGSNL